MIAVLSGDIIQSGSRSTVEHWQNELKNILTALQTKYSLLGSGAQIFRGDGFQLATDEPEHSLLMAILIRSGLQKSELKLDARIAIGLGTYDQLRDNILESDGEAFKLSGHLLDQLKKEKLKLALSSPFNALNNEMDVTLRLLGIVMDNWSQADAETVWLSWYEELSAKEIQAHPDISQPAVSKRKSSARLDEIQLLIKRYQYLIQHL